MTRLRLQPILSESQIDYLNGLPYTDTITEMGPTELHLVHACPIDPLYAYMPPQANGRGMASGARWNEWPDAADRHTHVAFVRTVGTGLVINPGSLGMPKDGGPHGSYAVLDGGSIQFCRIAYDPEPLIARLQTLNLPGHVFDQFSGDVPYGDVAATRCTVPHPPPDRLEPRRTVW